MIKAIFFDIDGTLLTFTLPRKIPKTTKEALEALRAKGIKLFIATGRSASQLEALKDHIDFDFDGYVAMNGQYCFNESEVIHKQMIPREDLEMLIPYLEESQVGCNFVELDYIYLNQITDQVRQAWKFFGRDPHENIMDTPSRALAQDTYQLSAYITEEEEEEFLKLLPNCKAARWHPSFTDIIPKTGGKNVGIEKVLQHYGIKHSETMAFGDGGNDIDMLKYVQIGVAMGNATDDVKKAADYVTTEVDHDGIMNALKYFGIL